MTNTAAVQNRALAAQVNFWRDLPREARLMLSVVALQCIGTGLVLPFTITYLHEVRGFPLGTVGLIIAIQPLCGLLSVMGFGGLAVDRIGARRVLQVTLLLMMIGDVIMALASAEWQAASALAVIGTSSAVSSPAQQSLIAGTVPTELRQRYFGTNFFLLNVGVGIGGVIGGVFLDVHRPGTFQAMYLGDACGYLPATLLLLGPLRHVAGPPTSDIGAAVERIGLTRLLRNPVMAALALAELVASFVGYSQLTAGFTDFARTVAGVSTRVIGFAFTINTIVVMAFQLNVLNRIEGRRRTRVVGVMGVLWAVAWLCLGSAGLVPRTTGASVLVVLCMCFFACGEILLQPTVPAIVNDIAPDHLRGQYNALSSGASQLAAIASPIASGFLLGLGISAVYIALLVLGSLSVSVISIRLVEPKVTPQVNGVHSERVT